MSKRVLVIGDVIIDEYTHGTPLGISAETPTVVAKFEKTEIFAGGAALVARNLLRLGCDVTLLTPTGFGLTVAGLIKNVCSDVLSSEEANRLTCPSLVHEGWNLTQKRRFFVNDYKMVQYDKLNEGTWETTQREVFFKIFKSYLDDTPKYDAIIICDNRHGVMDETLARCIIEMTVRPLVFVDSQVSQKGSNHAWYHHADFILMNERELNTFQGVTDFPKAIDLKDRMSAAKLRLSSEIIVKLGHEGSAATFENGIIRTEGYPASVVDTCGAGDAFLAGLVASNHELFQDRLEIANWWASRSVQLKGTIVPPASEHFK